ncbi:MAG: lamin tail domain-containing protein [Kiritimatiellae bacterium]|nr:lamin tail domain-containing protein [Kiritimatiellia bacterium]MDD5522320.1 lamin tail domain-containing protein [Kiritimatiellia bacterium]
MLSFVWKLCPVIGGFCLLFTVSSALAVVRISEIVANPATRLLQPSSNNLFQVGGGTPWLQPSFDDMDWSTAVGPFGFGTNYNTDLSLWRSGTIFSLYMRRSFLVDSVTATNADAVSFTIDFDSGFVAYLNGREILRKNLGAKNSFVYFDEPAFNYRKGGSNMTWVIGVSSNLFVSGTNVLAVQVHNYSNQTFTASPGISVNTVTGDVTLVSPSNQWRYFVGSHEPSGGIVEGVNPPAGIRGLEWSLLSFDAGEWPSGPGGIGYGDGDDATDVYSQMYNVCVSLYMRQEFVVSEVDAALTNKLSFIVNFDDGYIAYLNGNEISRTNMGAVGSFVPYNTAATAGHEAGVSITNVLAAANVLLVPGTNVLAIQAANQAPSSSDLSMIPDLRINGGTWLVNHANIWKYFVGTSSPVEESEEDLVPYEPVFADWVELWNDSTSSVSLAGWSLTDNKDDVGDWRFPTNALLLPNGRLVVLCTGLDITNSSASVWHTSFKLDPDGEYIGLYDAADTLVSEITPKYPSQSLFHSYGFNETNGTWRYYSSPTPGAINSGPSYEGMCATPVFLTPGGFHLYDILVDITSATPSSAIRLTFDGSEPTQMSMLYGGCGTLGISAATTIRARAFRDGWIPSSTATRTFLVNLPVLLRDAPAIALTGDWKESIHKSNGVTSIVGGTWTNAGIWAATSMDDFNIPVKHGRPYERPLSVEYLVPNGKAYQIDAGIRAAGSAYTRPRYILQNMSTQWYSNASVNKPALNLYFRSEYGNEPYTIPFGIDGEMIDFESMRLRGGHNDWDTPFIRDELCRRLLTDTGQASSRGGIVSLFVNSVFRCYYNPCQRYDTDFLRTYHGGTNEWDIKNHAGITSGDAIEWSKILSYAATKNLTIQTNYQTMASMLDMENLCDYMLVNIYAAMSDWPGNNYYTARERTTEGKWRFYVWDAEGGFGGFGRTPGYMIITSNWVSFVSSSYNASAYLFAKLRTNGEFRLLFADRAYEHLFNDGALTSSNILFHVEDLRAQVDPLRKYVRNAGINTSSFTNWVNNRLPYVIADMQNFGLWPALAPPLISPFGGPATNGTQITISNTNGVGTIYYALDGIDPRAMGGAVVGTQYTVPLVLDKSTTIKARVLNGTNWSALAREEYFTDPPPLVITEIMYNPASNGVEFIELFNAGDKTIDLSPVSFTNGIAFNFSDGNVPRIAAGEYVVVVQDLALFATNYNTNTINVAGVYYDKLSNGGEEIDLAHSFFGVLQKFDYRDDWYPNTDGGGFSLTLRDTATPTNLMGLKTSWKPSSIIGGSPGAPDPGGVPLPGTVVINELLSHTDASPVGDWVELYNTTNVPIDIGGWYLSDNHDNPYQYQIPSNTWIGAGGFLVFNATNHFDNPTNASPFAYSEYGEEVVLSSGFDSSNRPTGYMEVEDFDAAEREITFGRYIRSDGDKDFVVQVSSTPGAVNSGPRIGPLVISQILYEPASNAIEYIEFYNLSSSNTLLYDPLAPTNTWRIEGAVDYSFPTGMFVYPFSNMIVCATNAAAFRTYHGLSTNQPVFGPFTGSLDNAGENIRLMRPLEFEFTNMPFSMVDRVAYDNTSPWPVPPQAGYSIERIRMAEYGNDPVNWRLGSLSGTPGPRIDEDSDGDGIPDVWEAAYGKDFTNSVDGMLDGDSDGHGNNYEYIAGTNPTNQDDVFTIAISISNEQFVVSFLARRSEGIGYEKYNRRYSLEYLTNLMSINWVRSVMCSNLLGSNQVFQLLDTPTNNPLYYRGKVWLEQK